MKTRSIMLGGTSVLIILIMLCMLSLGTLSMMSAFSDLKLARTAANWTIQYYKLEKKANTKLQQANMTLTSGQPQDLTQYGWEINVGTLCCDLAFEGERTQNLRIELVPSPPDEYGRRYRIVKWQQWQDNFEYEQEGLDIWQPE